MPCHLGKSLILALYPWMAGDSDWTIHRGGAVTFEGVADVSLTDSTLSALGGNGILISNDAKNVELSNNTISDIGDSGVVVLGSMLRSTGLGARHFPFNVSITGNTIQEIGRFGKQVTGDEPQQQLCLLV